MNASAGIAAAVSVVGSRILRPYKIDSVAAIRTAFGRYRRVLFVLPTGGGRTVIADQVSAALSAMAKAKPNSDVPISGDSSWALPPA